MPEDTLDPDVTQFSVETVHTAPQRSSCWTRLRVGVSGVQSAMNTKPGCSVPSSDAAPPTIQQLQPSTSQSELGDQPIYSGALESVAPGVRKTFQIENLEFGAYICQKPGCGRSFTRPHELEAHMSYHNEEGGYVCKVPGCEMRFKHSEILTRHERIHARHKIHVCDICQKKIIGSENWEIHKIVHSLEMMELDSMDLSSLLNQEIQLRQQEEQQQPSTRFPLLQACTSTDTVNTTCDINADMAASALDYDGATLGTMDTASSHYSPHRYQYLQPQTSSHLSILQLSIPEVTENAMPTDSAISNTNVIHFQPHRDRDETFHIQQHLSDLSIQPEFTEDATGLPSFNDIVISDTNRSVLYQSPRYSNQTFESQQSLADFPTVRLFISTNTGLTRSMNSTINYNRSSVPHQQDNQLYQSQQSLPDPSIQHTSEAANTHLLQPFDTTHGKSKSSCLYQDPTYVDQFYQQQQPLPERTLEQTIGPIATRSTNIITDNVNKNSGDYGNLQNTSLLYQHQIVSGPQSREPNRQIAKRPSGDADSSVKDPSLDVVQRSCPQVDQHIPRLSQPGTVAPSVTSETANTADSARHSSDVNTELAVTSGLSLSAAHPTQSLNITAAPVPLCGPQKQEPNVANSQKLQSGPYICKKAGCGKSFARSYQLAAHMRYHNQEANHVCDWPGCQMRFIYPRDLTRHKRIHTGEKPCVCDKCGKRFARSDSLKEHNKIHDPENAQSVSCYKCKEPGCGLAFRLKSHLQAHIRWHKGSDMHVCTWPECKMQFKTKQTLQHHMICHKEKKTYRCELCNRRYFRRADLARHMRIHGAKKGFPFGAKKCSRSGCGKSYRMSSQLRAHMRWHDGKGEHDCEWTGCEMRFHSISILRKHALTHYERKPFMCIFCSKEYTQRSSLIEHMKDQHREGSPETRSTENQETTHPGTTDEVLAEEERSRVDEDGKEGEK